MVISKNTQTERALSWCQSLLQAISTIQRQLQSGIRHSESIACILNEAMVLTGCSAGMLAAVSEDEPCRLTETISASESRVEILAEYDDLARLALHRGKNTISTDCRSAALPLAIGNEIHGVLVLSEPEAPWTDEVLSSMAPFAGMAASVLRQYEEDLSPAQVEAVFDSLADGILTANDSGQILSINPAAEQMFGYNTEEVVGQSVAMLLPEPFASRHDEYLERYRQTGEISIIGYGRELDGLRKDGSEFPMDVSISRVEMQGREVFVMITRDITEHKVQQQMIELERANSQTLELLVRIDALTGIANRRHFDEALSTEVRRAARDKKPVSLLLCDIDFFKAFNDRYGHLAGDKALRSVAQTIDASFQRAGEVAARYGGEEFGVVIPGADLDTATRLAEAMHKKISDLSIPHGASRVADHVTISVGVASTIPGPHFDATQLLEVADRALYRAKGAGRHRVEAASPARDLKAGAI